MNQQIVRRTLRLLKVTNLGVSSYINADMAKDGMTAAQCDVLAYLMRKGESQVCSTDIHRDLGISKAGVSALLKKLKAKGFLILESDPVDDRQKRIRLTGEAWKLYEHMEHSMAHLVDGLYQDFTEEETETFMLLIQRMYKNLKTIIKEEA